MPKKKPSETNTVSACKEGVMEGAIKNIGGIQVFEDKNMREGTYIALDKNGIPIKGKDIKTTPIAKIVVHSIKTFEMAIENNGGSL